MLHQTISNVHTALQRINFPSMQLLQVSGFIKGQIANALSKLFQIMSNPSSRSYGFLRSYRLDAFRLALLVFIGTLKGATGSHQLTEASAVRVKGPEQKLAETPV